MVVMVVEEVLGEEVEVEEVLGEEVEGEEVEAVQEEEEGEGEGSQQSLEETTKEPEQEEQENFQVFEPPCSCYSLPSSHPHHLLCCCSPCSALCTHSW